MKLCSATLNLLNDSRVAAEIGRQRNRMVTFDLVSDSTSKQSEMNRFHFNLKDESPVKRIESPSKMSERSETTAASSNRCH